LKKQLKAAEKVVALKRAFKNSWPEKKVIIRRKLAVAKRYLNRVAAKAAATRPKSSRIECSQFKIKKQT
jgi:hypothetical protein